jgi:hypothetical protein
MADDRKEQDRTTVDRQGTSFMVPLGISLVFVVLAILWVSMSGNEDRSKGSDVLNRPNAPSRSAPNQ